MNLQSIQEALNAQGVTLERRLRKLPSSASVQQQADSASAGTAENAGADASLLPKPLLPHEVFSAKKLFASTLSRDETPSHVWHSASVLDRQ